MKIKLPALIHATLHKKIGEDKWSYVEGPRLLLPFEVGQSCHVGSPFARTYGTDSWMTTAVAEILEIKRVEEKSVVDITFKTLSGTTYSLVVQDETYDRVVEVVDEEER